MTKLEFIARQFGKARHKVYEHYVVTRIWHLLQDSDVKCITQQHVNKPDGKRYLTDMYFPQFELHIEVDEAHHVTQLDLDQVRQKDIIDATKHEFERVKVNCGIDEVNRQIDLIVTFIKNKIANQHVSGAFKRWDLEAEQNPQTYIAKGYIDASEDVAFRTIADAASCFGQKYRGLQTAWVAHPTEIGKRLWFPKLYPNDDWENSITADEETIYELCMKPDEVRKHINRMRLDTTISRLVFARVKGSLGDVMYRFKGEYKTDKEASNYEIGSVHRRIGTRVKTYPNPESVL